MHGPCFPHLSYMVPACGPRATLIGVAWLRHGSLPHTTPSGPHIRTCVTLGIRPWSCSSLVFGQGVLPSLSACHPNLDHSRPLGFASAFDAFYSTVLLSSTSCKYPRLRQANSNSTGSAPP
ncbi:hypothetical protein VNO77_20173 [Canavalia gladiata]|uniref:Uncharacterized protein n=1 Tax=Canavalia gladiata TaxID=3824 RepID=A0AAN9LSZ3_CANGL